MNLWSDRERRDALTVPALRKLMTFTQNDSLWIDSDKSMSELCESDQDFGQVKILHLARASKEKLEYIEGLLNLHNLKNLRALSLINITLCRESMKYIKEVLYGNKIIQTILVGTESEN